MGKCGREGRGFGWIEGNCQQRVKEAMIICIYDTSSADETRNQSTSVQEERNSGQDL